MSDVALDGTLRAVIAADRLASSEANDGPELLRRLAKDVPTSG